MKLVAQPEAVCAAGAKLPAGSLWLPAGSLLTALATSMSRYNGGVRALRLYGSRAITTFCVHRPEDDKRPELWVNIEVGGPTPGERKTRAKELAEPKIRELLAKHGIEV